MSQRTRTHRATSPDGTEVVASLHGDGPAVVFLHAGLGDAEQDWARALPLLEGRFSCHMLSYRPRGASGDSPDRSPPRVTEDVVAYVESLDAPPVVAAPSGGGMAALAAAARSRAVRAVATYEPIVFEALGGAEAAAFEQAYARMADTAAQGRLEEAARDWLAFFANAEEMQALAEMGYFTAAARYVPVLLEEIRQAMAHDGPGPTDPGVLRDIRVPVLLLQGTESTLDWYDQGIRHVMTHVPDAHVMPMPGLGHMGSWVEPAPVVEALAAFVESLD